MFAHLLLSAPGVIAGGSVYAKMAVGKSNVGYKNGKFSFMFMFFVSLQVVVTDSIAESTKSLLSSEA